MKKMTISAIITILLLSACATHNVLFNTEPQGAKLFLNGREWGTTPVYVPLRHRTFGQPMVSLQKEGYETYSTPIYYSLSVPALILDIGFFPPLLLFNLYCPGDVHTYYLRKVQTATPAPTMLDLK